MSARNSVLWGTLVVLSLLTWLAVRTLWSVSLYFTILGALAVACGLLAVLLFRRERTLGRRLLVIGLLSVGQLWLLQFLFMQLVWRARGFAP
jgi:hypothetical protein